MSCRVLSRGMEDLTFNTLLQIAVDNGCDRIVGRYRKTAKNGMVENLLPSLGFSLAEKSEQESVYKLEGAGLVPRTQHLVIRSSP